jgi:hypothetical protein
MIHRVNHVRLKNSNMNTQDVKFPENADDLLYYCDVNLFNIQTLWLFHDLKMKRECQQCLAETIKKKNRHNSHTLYIKI